MPSCSLVAGDVNQVRPQMESRVMAMAAPALRRPRPAPTWPRNRCSNTPYTPNRPTTIAENQTSRWRSCPPVACLHAGTVAQGQRVLLPEQLRRPGPENEGGGVREFDNKEVPTLAHPCPKGIIRVYKKDRAYNAQFIGEDRVDHTPKNEKVRLKLGDAFDVTADKKQTDFKKIGGSGKYNYQYEAAFEVVLKTPRKRRHTVTVQEPMPGDWQVLSSSHPYTKGASNTAVWKVAFAEGSNNPHLPQPGAFLGTTNRCISPAAPAFGEPLARIVASA